MAADLAAVAVGFAIVFGIQAFLRDSPPGVVYKQLGIATATLPVWTLSFKLNKTYVARAVERSIDETRRIMRATLSAAAAIVGISFLVKYESLSRLWVLLMLVIVTGTVIAERRVARSVFVGLRKSGRLRRRVIIVGTGPDAEALAANLDEHPELGYDVCGFLGDGSERHRADMLGNYEEAERVLDEQHANGVLISPSSMCFDDVNRLTRRLTDGGYHVALSSGLRDIDAGRFRTQVIDGRTLLYIEPIIRGGWRANAKRTFDVFGAVVGIVLTAPIMLAATVAIKATSRGPVVFSQTRVGIHGAPFTMYKLRSMVVDAEELREGLLAQNQADGPLFKISNDPRTTRVGRLLRKTSIDELPQLWNVLRGEMSLVGPRPALPHEVREWSPELHERLRVLPGITGLWQVSGRANATFADYARFDKYYVDNWSLGKDLSIVAKTIIAVVRSSGAH